MALLGKQAWSLLSADSLWARQMKQKYFPNVDFMNSKCPGSSSKVWKTFHHLKLVLNSGLRWHVGDGTTINAWKEPWIPQTPRPLPLLEKPENCSFELVAEFIDSELIL
ncbi:hypothetical protein FRX31_021280 [Thalictrum thalictroides]|uniref:Uncharacterized protein n=1 Tax=Thalictrum thalictroides TaxID=46969 RepID=A0A7J6VVL1_THATH|nr:hypothetical protein FRX31_021280 [Thalictrum thalictroides]